MSEVAARIRTLRCAIGSSLFPEVGPLDARIDGRQNGRARDGRVCISVTPLHLEVEMIEHGGEGGDNEEETAEGRSDQ